MSEDQPVDNNPKMSKFLHEYRKKLSVLKIKSFYANHLCKLHSIPDSCFNDCDSWLRGFYQIKRQKTPQDAQTTLYEVQNKYETVKNNEDLDFQKAYARAKYQINMYLDTLDYQLNKKIDLQSVPLKK